MNPELVQALVTIAVGALAGGLTNTIAVWMLFHPYEPPTFMGRTLGFFQGAIPKSQERLAAAIGRTVGNRLLTEEDLARTFTNQEFRAAFDRRLSNFLRTVLLEERPSLRAMLPEAVVAEVEPVLEEAVAGGVERLEDYLASREFEAYVADRADALVASVADEPIGGILTPARERAVEAAVDEWLEDAVASDDFRQAVDDYLTRVSEQLLEPGRTFEDVLPLGLVSSMENAIAGYLPLAIERLGRLLEDPEARARFEATIHELLRRFITDLKFHQRVVARVVMTEEAVDKVLDTIEAEGAERLSEMLTEPAVQEAMARGVNEAIVDFLRKPVREVLGAPDDPSVAEARGTLAGWVVTMARDPETRSFVVEKLHVALDKVGSRSWGEVLERVPPERVVGWVVAAARSESAGRALRSASGGLVAGVLDRPIGTPGSWLPQGAPERMEQALGDPLWGWLQGQIPEVVERVDVARRVEEKVVEFPMARLEEMVRKVTDRELGLIVRLGYVLGAVIGTVLVVVDSLLGG